MAITFEIQVSTSGVGDASFAALATVADAGGPLTFDHSPVTPGQLYIYRARRRDDGQDPECQYSDWSYLAFVRAAHPEGNIMESCSEKIQVGTETGLWLAVEACEGIPSKAQYGVSYTDGEFTRTDNTVFDTSLRDSTTMRQKGVKDTVGWQGTFNIVITPEGAVPRLLQGGGPVETTTLSTPTRYRHRFPNKKGGSTLTLIQKKGDAYHVYPGCRVVDVQFAPSKEQNSVLMLAVTLTALDEIVFETALVPTAATLLGVSTAPTDPLPPYSAALGLAEINDLAANVRSFNFGVGPGVKPAQVFNGKRGAKKSFRNRTDISASATLFYTDTTHLRRDMGVVNPTGAYAVGDTLVTAPVSLEFQPEDNAGGFSNVMGWYLTAAEIKAGTAVEGPEEIPENLVFNSLDLIGNSAGTDFYLEITNSEANADLTAPSDAILSVPPSAAKAYHYGVTKAGSLATSVISDSTHLSSADDFYNGLYVRFIDGALAGEKRLISDYAGATRTFTVAAFGSAPAADDIFEVVTS